MQLKISKYIDDHAGEMISTLSSLIAIPSVKGEPMEGMPFGVENARALAKMLELAEKYGFKTTNHENYVGTIDFDDTKELGLGVLCHLDVVPEGTGWTNPPYTLTLSGGKLYGRGVADDKGPAIAVLFALRALRECGYRLSKNVRFIVGCDEESGSSDLVYYRQKEKLPPYVFTPDGSYPVINLERGRVAGKVSRKFTALGGAKTIVSAHGGTVINAVPDRAYATLKGFDPAEIENAKSVMPSDIVLEYQVKEGGFIELTAKGKAAHASQPEGGKNAITGLLKLLGALSTSDVSAPFFASLSELYRYGETDGETLGIKAYDEKSGALTFVLSKMSFENGEFIGEFDIRFPICETSGSVRAKMEKTLSMEGPGLVIEAWKGVEPHYTDENSEFVQKLLSVYTEMTHKKGYCISIGGGTYVHEIEGGVAFGAEFLGDDSRMHGADEFMTLEKLLLNAKIFAEAILRVCQ